VVTDVETRKLPLAALLPLAVAAFITVLTEALPAGVLPAMATDLRVGESAAGQSVTVYAIGTAIAAIPLAMVTARWRRRRLLLIGVVGFVIGNTVTAISSAYALTMVGRFVAGVAAGIVWALLAGYARRLAPDGLQGKAIALVMAGIPLALSFGIPAGTFLGGLVGWRVTFGVMSILAVALVFGILVAVPDFAGNARAELSLVRTLKVPGVAAVLFVVTVFVLAHTILYTYVAALLSSFGMARSVDLVLLVFGIASVASIWIVGAHIDRHLPLLTIVATVLVMVAAFALTSPLLVYVAIAIWGLGWGGVPTLLQTAAGKGGDSAQAMLVTLWNAATAAGGIIGGLLLDDFGAGSLPWTTFLLLIPALAVVAFRR
jgi:predicted MFS family arabinose efflux permease